MALTLKVHPGVLTGVSYLYVAATGGKISVSANDISVSGANEATFYLTAATNFVNYDNVSGNPEAICKNAIAAVSVKSFATVKSAHIADYQKYFNTFSIDLGKTANDSLPTDQRILKFTKTNDPSFISLYTQFARYLLIASSRPGGGPANLQGFMERFAHAAMGQQIYHQY